jgi:ribosomal protein L21E
MKVDEIKSYLKTFEEIDNVDVTFFPSWLKKMPYFKDHIIIKIAQ